MHQVFLPAAVTNDPVVNALDLGVCGVTVEPEEMSVALRAIRMESEEEKSEEFPNRSYFSFHLMTSIGVISGSILDRPKSLNFRLRSATKALAKSSV